MGAAHRARDGGKDQRAYAQFPINQGLVAGSAARAANAGENH